MFEILILILTFIMKSFFRGPPPIKWWGPILLWNHYQYACEQYLALKTFIISFIHSRPKLLILILQSCLFIICHHYTHTLPTQKKIHCLFSKFPCHILSAGIIPHVGGGVVFCLTLIVMKMSWNCLVMTAEERFT